SISHLHVALGKILRSERRRRHLTIDDLARKTDHTRAYVAAVEEGRRSGKEADFLRKACRVLAIDPFTVVAEQERIIRELKTRVHRLDLMALSSGSSSDSHETVTGATPILVGDECIYPSEFDSVGNLVAAVEGFLSLPDLSQRPTFALRLQGEEMTGGREPALQEGDLVVFATDRSARSGECAFVRFAGDRTSFRRIFHDDGPIYRLQAMRSEFPPILLSLEELTSAWPLVAHLSLFE
ncbi:MAG: XRE family transcriptional regulator, partial [Planctomycetota bacterium]